MIQCPLNPRSQKYKQNMFSMMNSGMFIPGQAFPPPPS
jgi:hypothetical protein